MPDVGLWPPHVNAPWSAQKTHVHTHTRSHTSTQKYKICPRGSPSLNAERDQIKVVMVAALHQELMLQESHVRVPG